MRHDGTWFRARVAPYAAAALLPAAERFPELTHAPDTIGNGRMTLTFGRTGEIVALVDADGAEHAGAGLNRLVLHRDPYQFPWDAWDIGRAYLRRTPPSSEITYWVNKLQAGTTELKIVESTIASNEYFNRS